MIGGEEIIERSVGGWQTGGATGRGGTSFTGRCTVRGDSEGGISGYI